jgi:GTPase SAR1 family protein
MTKNARIGDYDYMLKLVIIGNAGVGKSALLMRYVDEVFNQSYL